MLISQQDFPSIKLPKTLQWTYPLIDQISKKLNPSLNHENNFPCIFARRVFSLLNFRFLTVNWCKDQHTYDFKSFANELSSFLEETQQSDDNINNIEPLIVLFEPVKFIFSTHHYEKIFFDSLQYLIDHDKIAWNGCLPKNPNQEFWTMCFSGVQIFINVSHPNHKNRNSRNLCDTLVFVINPRERFDKFAGNNKKGHKIRERIRNNIDKYDLISRSPYLGHYQDGDLEWPQYMIPDDNDSPSTKCPLNFNLVKHQ